MLLNIGQGLYWKTLKQAQTSLQTAEENNLSSEILLGIVK
jgi:hypothetical protein